MRGRLINILQVKLYKMFPDIHMEKGGIHNEGGM